MACGCGGECCKQQVKGLGFLSFSDREESWDDGWGYFDWDYFFDAPWGGTYSTDWIQDTAVFGGYGYNPNLNSFSFIDSERFSGNANTGNTAWQSLIDWWRDFTGGYTGPQPAPSGGGIDSERGLPGYCPPGYYHPISDPYSCVPFPNETPQERNQRQIAQRQAQQQAAQRAAQQRAQQAAQPCPPNTGLVKNQQGQCVCPPGQAFSRSQGKCVLALQLTAEDRKALEGSDLWKYLAIGAFALIAIKAVK